MNFNFVETHVFTNLNISLDIYFSLAGLVAPPKLFSIFFIFCRYDFITKMNKMRGCPEEKIQFSFLVNHPNNDYTACVNKSASLKEHFFSG